MMLRPSGSSGRLRFTMNWSAARVPIVARLAGRGAAFQIKGPRSIEGQHLHAVLDRLDMHAPITCMSQGMEVAIIHERFQFHFEGRASPHQGVLNEGGVFALA